MFFIIILKKYIRYLIRQIFFIFCVKERLDSIIRHAYSRKVGQRIVGCCSNVIIFLWFFGYARFIISSWFSYHLFWRGCILIWTRYTFRWWILMNSHTHAYISTHAHRGAWSHKYGSDEPWGTDLCAPEDNWHLQSLMRPEQR